jgi:hypothetical protein
VVGESEVMGTLNSWLQEAQTGSVLSHFVNLRLRFGTRLNFAPIHCIFQSWRLFLPSDS